MQNANALLEKLMLNRAALMMKRFDKELKETLHNELQKLKSIELNISSTENNERLVA